MKKEQKTVVVYEGEQYDDGFPKYDWTLPEVIGWLQGKLEAIPAEYLQSSRCEFAAHSSYDLSLASITITYTRMETDEEAAARESEVKRRLAEEERNLLARLEQIKAGKLYG